MRYETAEDYAADTSPLTLREVINLLTYHGWVPAVDFDDKGEPVIKVWEQYTQFYPDGSRTFEADWVVVPSENREALAFWIENR